MRRHAHSVFSEPENAAAFAEARAKLSLDHIPLLGAVFRIPTFAALRYRNYLLLWIGMMNHSGAMWMEQVAQSWLMWELTGSPLALGMVNFFRAAPFLLFATISGVIVDRFDKRRLLIMAESVSLVLALVLAGLIFTGLVEVWHVYLYAFLAGSAMTVNQPARQVLIPSLVEDTDLMNAIALNSTAMNLNRVLGPTVAGLLIGVVSIGGIYALEAVAYGLFIVATLLMKLPSTASIGKTTSPLRDVLDGLSYIWSQPVVRGLIILALVPMIFGMPYSSMLPVFADEILGIGAAGLGLLLSSAGIGALISSVVIASLGSFRRQGYVLLGGVFAFGLGLVGLALSQWLAVSIPILAVVGLSQIAFLTTTNTALLTITPREYHGRVMSIYMLDRGLVPLGSLLIGFLAELTTVPLAVSIMGSVCMALALVMAMALPAVRRL